MECDFIIVLSACELQTGKLQVRNRVFGFGSKTNCSEKAVIFGRNLYSAILSRFFGIMVSVIDNPTMVCFEFIFIIYQSNCLLIFTYFNFSYFYGLC